MARIGTNERIMELGMASSSMLTRVLKRHGIKAAEIEEIAAELTQVYIPLLMALSNNCAYQQVSDVKVRTKRLAPLSGVLAGRAVAEAVMQILKDEDTTNMDMARKGAETLWPEETAELNKKTAAELADMLAPVHHEVREAMKRTGMTTSKKTRVDEMLEVTADVIELSPDKDVEDIMTALEAMGVPMAELHQVLADRKAARGGKPVEQKDSTGTIRSVLETLIKIEAIMGPEAGGGLSFSEFLKTPATPTD